jgi:hypothetical protein
LFVLNVHAPTDDKTDDVKESFYVELECVIDKFPKYHMEILLGDFNAKAGREEIFKSTIGNVSLHEISNDNGVWFFKKWDRAMWTGLVWLRIGIGGELF